MLVRNPLASQEEVAAAARPMGKVTDLLEGIFLWFGIILHFRLGIFEFAASVFDTNSIPSPVDAELEIVILWDAESVMFMITPSFRTSSQDLHQLLLNLEVCLTSLGGWRFGTWGTLSFFRWCSNVGVTIFPLSGVFLLFHGLLNCLNVQSFGRFCLLCLLILLTFHLSLRFILFHLSCLFLQSLPSFANALTFLVLLSSLLLFFLATLATFPLPFLLSPLILDCFLYLELIPAGNGRVFRNFRAVCSVRLQGGVSPWMLSKRTQSITPLYIYIYFFSNILLIYIAFQRVKLYIWNGGV